MRDPEFSKYISQYSDKIKKVETATFFAAACSRRFNELDKGPGFPPSEEQKLMQNNAVFWINLMHRYTKELSELEKYIQIRFADYEPG